MSAAKAWPPGLGLNLSSAVSLVDPVLICPRQESCHRCPLVGTSLQCQEGKVAQSCPTLFKTLLCPWNSPGKNTRVGSHSLLLGDLFNPGIKPSLLYYRQSLPSEPPGKPRRWALFMPTSQIRSLGAQSGELSFQRPHK